MSSKLELSNNFQTLANELFEENHPVIEAITRDDKSAYYMQRILERESQLDIYQVQNAWNECNGDADKFNSWVEYKIAVENLYTLFMEEFLSEYDA